MLTFSLALRIYENSLKVRTMAALMIDKENDPTKISEFVAIPSF